VAAPRLQVVSPSELPEPPYPAATAVNGWRFEIDMQRIRRSDTWALCPREYRPWLLLIWVAAWEQVPAGSLPNNHALIAGHIDMDARIFGAHADMLLRGFRLHSDGRLYHHVVVERVRALLDYRESERLRKEEYRKGLKNKDTRPASVPRDSHVTPVGETPLELELEQERRKEESPSDSCRAGPTTHAAEAILAYLNERAGTRFQPVKANLDRIKARLREYDEETLRGVVDRKCAQWRADEKMRQYLRPATLFCAEKCAQYVGENTQAPIRKQGNFLGAI